MGVWRIFEIIDFPGWGSLGKRFISPQLELVRIGAYLYETILAIGLILIFDNSLSYLVIRKWCFVIFSTLLHMVSLKGILKLVATNN